MAVGVLQSVGIGRRQRIARGIVGQHGRVIHMCVYLGVLQRSLAHGEPRAVLAAFVGTRPRGDSTGNFVTSKI